MINSVWVRSVVVSIWGASLLGCSPAAQLSSSIDISSDAKLTFDCQKESYEEHEVSGVPIITICRTQTRVDNLELLNEAVFQERASNSSVSGRDGVSPVFVVIPVSPHSRCVLDFIPEGGEYFESYSGRWLGGFHSPCHSEVFDVSGRQIAPGEFSPSDFPNFVGNLPVPEYRVISDNEIEVSAQKIDIE